VCCVFFLGLDGIDHLGLGGALRGARTVFRSGIHTWYHCRYVSSSLVSLSYLHLCCYFVPLSWFYCSSFLFFSVFSILKLFFFFLGFRELYRVWIICTHIRHYGSTSRSKSCSTVTRDMRVVRLHRRVSHLQTIIVPPWPRSRTTHISHSQSPHRMASTFVEFVACWPLPCGFADDPMCTYTHYDYSGITNLHHTIECTTKTRSRSDGEDPCKKIPHRFLHITVALLFFTK